MSNGSQTYYIRIRGKIHGPFDVEKLKKLKARGQFSRANEISVDKHSWQPATALADLFEPASVSVAEEVEPSVTADDYFGPSTFATEAANDDGWHYVVGDERHGPVTSTELRRLASNSQLRPSDLVWRAGMAEWQPASHFAQIFPGGKRAAWYRSRWFRGTLLALCIVVAVAGACAVGWFASTQMGRGYGTLIKFNNGELYYTAPFSEEDARRLGNFLVQEKVFDGEQKTVQLTRSDKSYAVRMIVKKGIELDQDYVRALRILGAQIAHQVFADAPLEIHMCDDHLATLRVIPTDPLTGKR
jgi:hypothetical protein